MRTKRFALLPIQKLLSTKQQKILPLSHRNTEEKEISQQNYNLSTETKNLSQKSLKKNQTIKIKKIKNDDKAADLSFLSLID